jgi:RNA polymerase sigma-70 factor, ECF subfamily
MQDEAGESCGDALTGTVPTNATPAASTDDLHVVQALLEGDEAAFVNLVEQYQSSLLRLALTFVPSHAVAEEVVQETWIGVLNGLSRFEGRSSLKTWIFRILTNQAKTRGVRERRSVPFSSLAGPDDDTFEAAVEAVRFRASGEFAGHWSTPPRPWEQDTPEALLLSGEARARIQEAIDALPPNQRQVITMRDIEGWSAAEVCNTLEVTETNQRVLLHRARAKVRRAIEHYVDGA